MYILGYVLGVCVYMKVCARSMHVGVDVPPLRGLYGRACRGNGQGLAAVVCRQRQCPCPTPGCNICNNNSFTEIISPTQHLLINESDTGAMSADE